MAERGKGKLRDGSHIVEVHKMWCTGWNGQQTNIIEATTSYGQKILASIGNREMIGRKVSEAEPNDEFHIMDYDIDFTTFIDVHVQSNAAVAIDDCGEVWVLAG